MKVLIASMLMFSLLLFGCVSTGQEGSAQVPASGEAEEVTVPASGEVSTSPAADSPETNPDTGGETQTQSSAVREITMTARQWQFEPATVEVMQGDHVKLRITSVDVAHGFAIPQLGVNSRLEPGQETVVEFDATTPGRYTFFCSVVCGSGHGDMRGTLIVN